MVTLPLRGEHTKKKTIASSFYAAADEYCSGGKLNYPRDSKLCFGRAVTTTARLVWLRTALGSDEILKLWTARHSLFVESFTTKKSGQLVNYAVKSSDSLACRTMTTMRMHDMERLNLARRNFCDTKMLC